MVAKYIQYTLLHNDCSIRAYWNVLAWQVGSNDNSSIFQPCGIVVHSNSCIFKLCAIECLATSTCLITSHGQQLPNSRHLLMCLYSCMHYTYLCSMRMLCGIVCIASCMFKLYSNVCMAIATCRSCGTLPAGHSCMFKLRAIKCMATAACLINSHGWQVW